MNSKTLTIYTATDTPAKRLRAPTQIVFTLTPADQSQLFKTQTPLAWQIVTFAGHGDAQETVTWSPVTGFTSISVTDDIVTPLLGTRVKTGHKVQFEKIAGTIRWSKPKSGDYLDDLVAKNSTGVPQSLALCSIYGNRTQGPVESGWTLEPLVHFSTTPDGKEIIVGPPVMLQAYAVSGYKKGQFVSVDNQDDFLFSSWDGDPQPVNISKLPDTTTWRLYSDHTGEVKLDRV